ncbi:MAG: PASTA domain-containing protein [Actinobacteria bacterium]|nr:PASTA domain-containing protein [Actinomycetota bacterium]
MATNEALSGLLLAGRYRLHQRRGAGGDGLVMDAIDEQLQRTVAVRVFEPEWAATRSAEQRFLAEAQAAASLVHPNINAVYDFGIDDFDGDKRPYLVLEYLSGGSLRDILDRGRLLSPSQALVVGLDACRGLDYIHRRGIIHRDLRPGTMVFGDDHRMRLVDLGVSRLRAEQTWVDLSAVGIDAARYASPEQAQGLTPEDGSIDTASDIYSLCLVLIEAVTGQIPFASDSTVATLNARIDKLMPVSADFGPLASILERAGRPLPNDRFTAAEFGKALMQAAEKLPRPAAIPTAGNSLFADTTGGALRDVAESAADEASADDLADATLPLAVAAAATNEINQLNHINHIADVDGIDGIDDIEPPVFDQGDDNPHHARSWLLGMLVVVMALLAGGFVAYRVIVTKSYTVPDLAGIEKGVAENQIADNEWVVVVKTERSDQQAVGNVISSEPPAGSKLAVGKTFVLVVSDGPTLPKLVDVNGMTLDVATAKLAELKLGAPVASDAFNETVAVGQIVSWSVPAQPSLVTGMEVVQGTVIAVVVSKGPEPRVVPQLVGLDVEAAKAALVALQLTMVKTDDVFSDVPIGLVAQQSVAAGGTVDRDGSVSIALSKGPDLVVMPNLSGLKFDAVQKALTDAGLVVGVVAGNTAGFLYGINVAGVPVVAGQQLPRATVIDLSYY